MSRRPVAADLLLGIAAGAAATWLMDKTTSLMYERQSEEARNREDAARGGRNAYENAAEKLAGLLEAELEKDEREALGSAIHWSLGISTGAMYGMMRNRIDWLGLGSGIAFGVLFFLAMDEGALTALGLAPPPTRFPWQTHARGLAGHVVLGAILDAAFAGADLATR